MKDKALVTDITEKEITVIPLITDACLNCTSGCAKQGKPFCVSNPDNIQIQKGSVVKIAASKKSQAIQGLLALLLPVCFAAAGFFISGPLSVLFNIQNSDGLQAVCVLACFFISAAVIFFVTRKKPFSGKPEIVDVY